MTSYVYYYANQFDAEHSILAEIVSTDPNNSPHSSVFLTFTDPILASLNITGNYVYWTVSFNSPSGSGNFYPGDPVPINPTQYFFVYPAGEMLCFGENTKITCLVDSVDQQVKISEMNNDSIVKTFSTNGDHYEKVYQIGSGICQNGSEKWKENMYILENYPNLIEPLTVTGGHSILVDRYNFDCLCRNGKAVKIEGKYLLLAGLSPLFKKIEDKEAYKYYHFCLESDDENKRHAVYANGILSETPSKLYWNTHSLKPNDY